MQREQSIALATGIGAVLIGALAWTLRTSEEPPAWLGPVDPMIFLLGAIITLIAMRIVLMRQFGSIRSIEPPIRERPVITQPKASTPQNTAGIAIIVALLAGAGYAYYSGLFSFENPAVVGTITIGFFIIIAGIVIISARTPRTQQPIQQAPPTHAAPPAPARESPAPTQWNDLPVEKQAKYMSIIALVLGFFIYPIGPIIGFALIARFKPSDSSLVMVTRVVLAISLVLPILFFVVVFWLIQKQEGL